MIVKIGDVISEYSVRNKFDENIPVYSVTNEKGFCTGYFSKEVASKDKSTYKIVPRGYFAYNPSRINVGSVDWQKYEDRVIVSPLYVVFGVSDRLDRQYLLHYLKSDMMLSFIKEYATGSVRDNLKLADLGKFPINLRPVEEQHQIATTLDKIDDLIAKRRQQLDKLDELVQSRFIEMVGDCVVNPKGWKTKCLEDIAEVGSSKRVFIEELQEAGIPFYRGTEVGALAEGKQISPELFITEEHYTELCKATGAPQIGDLLMPSICPDGRIWVVNTEDPFYFKDGRVLWVHAIDNSYNPVFLLYTLKDRIMADYSSIASGTTFAELKIFALKKCRIFDVPIALQNEFAAFVAQTDKSKLAIQKSLDKLEILKKALMQKYFG